MTSTSPGGSVSTADWMVEFYVIGEPAPQGSSRAFVRGGRAVVTGDNTKTRPWRSAVAWEAREAWRHAGHDTAWNGPVAVSAVFYLSRPPSAPKRRVWPEVKPDLDKLTRALLDALATDAGCLVDDSRVIGLSVAKRYASDTHPPGVHVVVRPV